MKLRVKKALVIEDRCLRKKKKRKNMEKKVWVKKDKAKCLKKKK